MKFVRFVIYFIVSLRNFVLMRIQSLYLKSVVLPLYALSLILCLWSCTNPSPNTYIPHLKGYWEIEKVILNDGTEKEYPFSPTVDFFEIQDTTGVRKKVQPKLDGHFNTFKDEVFFSYAIENDSLRLHFKSEWHTWTETVILADENQMILKNEAGNRYFYKPYQKLAL